jgi:hypothetical protein
VAARELTKKDGCNKCCRESRVEGHGMERIRIRRNTDSPRKSCRKACIGAFCEMAKSEKGPGESGARRPGVKGIQEREIAKTEVDKARDDGEKDACQGQRRHHKEKDGVGEEVVEIRCDQKETGEREGGEKREKAGVPELFRVDADDCSGSKAKCKGGHESNGGEDAVGGKNKMTVVD